MHRANNALAIISLSAAMVIMCSFTVGWRVWGQSNRPSENSLVFAHAVPGWEEVPVAPSSMQLSDRASKANSWWFNLHRHLLPVALGFFFVSFSGWSLVNHNITAKKSDAKSPTRDS